MRNGVLFSQRPALQHGLTAADHRKDETVNNMHKCYAVGVTGAAVILLCGLIRPLHAGVLDCISGLGGTGNPGGCTDADRKHFEELEREADAEVEAEKAKMLNCENDPNAPTDKCPAEYRKIIEEANAASMAKQQREYEIWLQGTEARKQDVKAKQEALLKRELSELDAQYRAAAQQNYEDQMRRDSERRQEQQAASQRSLDEFIRRTSDDEDARQAQRRIADQQERQIPQQRARPATNVAVRSDPLTPAPAPAQTPESRRAAGLPDDPAAAACIQDDDCARAVLSGH
jgi:hypothetical protein